MDPIIKFTFELFAETEKIYWDITKLVEWGIWAVWWFTLPATLPTASWNYLNAIELNNEWNHEAPIRLEIIWSCTNPKILNITNKYKYRIDWETSIMVFDNTNLLNNPKQRLVVTDNGVDIKAQRNSWSDIYLSPWLNYIVVTSDEILDDPLIRIRFRDTYSS